MGEEIIDLSLLAGEPRKVRLVKDGPIYLLPADLPIPTILRFEALKDRATDEDSDEVSDVEAVRELYGECLSVFQIHQPELDRVAIGGDQLFSFVQAVYGGGLEADESGEGPTSPPAGTKSSARAKKAKASAS